MAETNNFNSTVMVFDIITETNLNQTEQNIYITVEPIFQYKYAYLKSGSGSVSFYSRDAYFLVNPPVWTGINELKYNNLVQSRIIAMPSSAESTIWAPIVGPIIRQANYYCIDDYYLKDISFAATLFNEQELNQWDEDKGYIASEDNGMYITSFDYLFPGKVRKNNQFSNADAIKTSLGTVSFILGKIKYPITLASGIFIDIGLLTWDWNNMINKATGYSWVDSGTNKFTVTDFCKNKETLGKYPEIYLGQLDAYGMLIKTTGTIINSSDNAESVWYGIGNFAKIKIGVMPSGNKTGLIKEIGMRVVKLANESTVATSASHYYVPIGEVTSGLTIVNNVITGFTPQSNFNGYVRIPYGVTAIGNNAFSSKRNITSVYIPNTVTTIGNSAFADCNGLTSITIPNGVTYIGDGAFSYCSNLANITIPSSVTSIGDSAFYRCSRLANITIPSSVTSIGDSAFYRCSRLTSITIPSSVTYIGDSAFYSCEKLTDITIPNGVTSVGDNAFYHCTGLTSITIPSSVEDIGERAFSECYNLTSIIISDGVKSIGYDAFSFCSSLINITIPNSVKSIGDSAFFSCSGLKSIIISNSVISIGKSTFDYCSSLESITVDANSQYYASQDGILYNKAKTQIIFIPKAITGHVTIPNGITSIGDYYLIISRSSPNITAPSSAASIGDRASYTIDKNKIFYDCSRLTSITIPSSVISIGDSAFYNCTGLTNFIIPSSVKNVYMNAFTGCTNLSITWNYNPALTASAFNNYLKTVVIPDGTANIKAHAFYNCTGLTSVTIPDTVWTIDSAAFADCSGLTEIHLEKSAAIGIISLGKNAFNNCSNLMYIYMPDFYSMVVYENIENWSEYQSKFKNTDESNIYVIASGGESHWGIGGAWWTLYSNNTADFETDFLSLVYYSDSICDYYYEGEWYRRWEFPFTFKGFEIVWADPETIFVQEDDYSILIRSADPEKTEVAFQLFLFN